MQLIFVRHGETDWNVAKKYCGQLDVALNENGVRQMEQLREKLEDYSVDLVVTSDLTRVKQSANILSNAKVVRFSSLNEMDFGDFEGYTYQEISTKFPEAWNEYCNNWQTALFPNGESFPIFYERVVATLEAEMEKWQQFDTVLLVGHLGVLRVIALFLQKQTIAQYWDIDFKQGCYSLWDNKSQRFLISNQ
ncbi:alpha-ribazole phosphatase [Listeria monocytogenes]|uniref:alpha-ribazole phosphatase n=1 Tax=Listeria monocytogenes TaxID=1639 RepID=UPI0011F0DC86|nr:alpha-ribazole phosphatase [Listeria monocytogenes]EAG3840851.1 alpha-ribazole phosphatase [Listeria monocytogenes]TYV32438.1 alpha-ribazole phosphatase [Listeria monocytogenes]